MDSQDRLCLVGFVFLLFLIARPGWSQNNSVLWQPTDGPLGGDIHVLATDPSRGALLASDGKTLFQHDGTQWTSLGTPGETITAVYATHAGTYFLAVSRPHPDNRFALLSSIFRSNDGGLTWTSAGLTDLDGAFAFITHSPDNVVFAGGSLGLYRLAEDGASWTNVTPTGGHGALVADHLSFTEDGTLFTMSDGISVHKSENGGETWTVQHDYVTDTSVQSLAIDEDGVLFAGMSNLGDNFYIERSTDDGQTWERLDASSFPAVTLLAHEATLLAGTLGDGLLQSRDQGETWESLNLPARYVRILVAGPEGALFAGTSRGVYASADEGATWTLLGDGMRALTTTSLLVRTNSSLLAGTLGGGLFRSDDGQTWKQLDLPSIHVRTLLETETSLLVGTQQQAGYALEGAFYSTNDDETWERATFTTAAHPVFGEPRTITTTSVFDFLAHPDGTLYAAVYDPGVIFLQGVYRSEDGGQTWMQTLLRNEEDDPIGATALALGPNGTVLASTGHSLYALNEDGNTWTLRTQHPINTLLTQPNGNVLIGALDGLYRLSPGSDTPTRLALDNLAIHALRANTAGDVFAATDAGVFRSNNGGVSWHNVSAGLGEAPVLALALNAEDMLFAGTDGNGVYRTTPAFILTDTEARTDVPAGIALAQNYPNPFNPATTICYELATNMPVRLVVFDVLGRDVATLIHTMQTAGSYEVAFEATHLPSGLYFYRLETAEQSLSRRMLLLK